jgi:hypothetical protein
VNSKKKKASGSSMFNAAPAEGEDENSHGPVTGSEHLIGYLMKHILTYKIGVLPYNV